MNFNALDRKKGNLVVYFIKFYTCMYIYIYIYIYIGGIHMYFNNK